MLAQNLPVRKEFVTLADAYQVVNTAKLPPEARADSEGKFRLVRIGDYDVCACIGAYVEHTWLAAPFRLISHSFTEPDVLRLRFKVG